MVTVDSNAPVPGDADRDGMGGFWAVIPAGGAGTRLWPLSRAGAPKFLHDLTGGGRTLLQGTVDRLAPLAGDRLIVVTGVAHEEAVREQLPHLDSSDVLAEPLPRDSMAAIGWAAAVISRVDPDAVIGSFAADHVVGDEAAFRACVRQAVTVARTGRVVTLGITPTFPSTGFGYIHRGDPLGVPGAPDAYAVSEFVEKPDEATAHRYLESGEYRWNAGMFVVQARVLLDLLRDWHPHLADGLRVIAEEPARLSEIWPTLTKIAIDHAIAEPAAAAGSVAVVMADFPWDDVGDFHALADLVPGVSGSGPKVLGDASKVLTRDASGLIVTGDRVVAVVGLADVVVVDTPDALLVTTRERAQDVKSLVDELKQTGRSELT